LKLPRVHTQNIATTPACTGNLLSDHGTVVQALNAELKATKDLLAWRRKKWKSEGAIFFFFARSRFSIPAMFTKLDRKYSAFKEEV